VLAPPLPSSSSSSSSSIKFHNLRRAAAAAVELLCLVWLREADVGATALAPQST